MPQYVPFLTILLLAGLAETGAPLDPLDSGDSGRDNDFDGLANLREFQYGTDPLNPDTDGGGIPDGWEAYYDTHRTVFSENSSRALYDADGDGKKEAAVPPGCRFDPTDGADEQEDADDDLLCNFAEYCKGTDPTNPDTDEDGTIDGREGPDLIGCFTHPLDPPGDWLGDGYQGAGMAPVFSMSWDCYACDAAGKYHSGRVRQ